MSTATITQLVTTEPEGFSGFRVQIPPEFETVFSHFYFAENHSLEPITKTLLPSFETIIGFNFGASVQLTANQASPDENPGKKAPQKKPVHLRMGRYAIVGPIKKAFSYTLHRGAELLILNFRQDAFFRFFRQMPNAPRTIINPDLLIDQNCFRDWWQVLDEMSSLQDRVDYLLECCRPYIGQRDPRVAQILQNEQELKAGAMDPIKIMAAFAGQSIRNMQLQFKKQMGYTAKEQSRNQRFMQAILLIQVALDKGEKPDWFTIIDTCHYYDQSQLIKDFKYFMDLTPTQYLQFQTAICHSTGKKA